MKKKTSVYFLFPLIGLLAFGAVYWQFATAYTKKEEDRVAAKRAERIRVQEEKNALQKKVFDESLAATQLRKEQKAIEDKKKADRNEQRQKEANDKVRSEQDATRLANELQELERQVADAKETLKGIEQRKKSAMLDVAFYQDMAKVAVAKQKKVQDTHLQIMAAEKARQELAAAQAAAAAAAKK